MNKHGFTFGDPPNFLATATLTPNQESIFVNGKKIFCGLLQINDISGQEIAAVEFLKNKTVLKIKDKSEPIRSPLKKGMDLVFSDTEALIPQIIYPFAFIIGSNKDNEEKMLDELCKTCASQVKFGFSIYVEPTHERGKYPIDGAKRRGWKPSGRS